VKIIYLLLCPLLSSCVYYGTSHDIDIGNKTQRICVDGSTKENEQCRAKVKKLNEAIKNRTQS